MKHGWMVLCLLLAMAGMRLEAQEQPADKIIVACVGDSITEMQGKKKGKSYPGYLQGLLGEKYGVMNLGKSGTCVLKSSDIPYNKSDAYANLLLTRPDIVLIALGTNDSRANNWTHKKDFVADYQALIDTARSLPSKPLVMIALPIPMITTPGKYQYSLVGDNISKEIVPLIRKLAEDNKCPIVDFNAKYTSTPEAYIDGVHPSDDGLAQMASIAAEAIKALPAK